MIAAQGRGRRFATGARPVIRWIKGDGLDDVVTRAAIGQATRLFGAAVDYCLCTTPGIDAARVRTILEWADQPVEWWPVTALDNLPLAQALGNAGCAPERYGYWWKWFPERVRADAPEWILDGDMVVTGKPEWFDAWAAGTDAVRVTQDDRWPPDMLYGRYLSLVDAQLKLYSGLVSLPPRARYMEAIRDVLAVQPLNQGHDGCKDMCEQGVIAAAFQKLAPQPIPLNEFPFGRAFEKHLDFGLRGNRRRAWGYHFGHAFRRANPHFERLTRKRVVFSKTDTGVVDRLHWLGGFGQWGVPGWTMPDEFARVVAERAAAFAGRPVLEIGTSRGRVAALMAMQGCRVTTVDHQDRGATTNLAGLDVRIVQDDAGQFLRKCDAGFDLVVVDLHGNSEADWRALAGPLMQRLHAGGTLLLNNATLDAIPEWRAETGVRWFLGQLPADWRVAYHSRTPPGLAIVTRP